MRKTQQIGQILVELGYITQEQLVRAVMEQKNTGERLGAILLRRGYLTPEHLTEALALQSGLEYVRFSIAEVQPEAIAELSPALARRLRILPLRIENGKLVVAPLDIHNTESLQELYRMVDKPISLVCANSATVEVALRLYYPQDTSDIDLAANYPCVREFVDSLLKEAMERAAQAVHIEHEDAYTIAVRFRVGDRLETVHKVPEAYGRVITYRIKKLAGASQPIPQMHFSDVLRIGSSDGNVAIQVSCLQTSRGERAVLRFLSGPASDTALEDLSGDSANALQHILTSRRGLFLVSGEDLTSCQAILREALQRKAEEGVVAFCLDPTVAQGLSGVHLVGIEDDSPASLESLRAVLAQDPDVVVAGMVESAVPMQILIAAAEAGVWVAVALRAADVGGALNRLRIFGVTPIVTASTLVGIVQVHTLPRLCSSCRIAHPAVLPEWLVDSVYEAPVYNAPGCERCRHTGYSGTVSVIEVFSPDAGLREMLIQDSSPHEMDKAIRSYPQSAFRATLRQKVLSGQISLQHAQILWERQYPSAKQSHMMAA